MKICIYLLCLAILLLAAVSGAQEVYLDPGVISGGVSGSGLLDLGPEWLAGVIPAIIIAIASLINALVPNKVLGPLSKVINGAALAFHKGAVDPVVNE